MYTESNIMEEKNILIVEGDPDHASLIIDDLMENGISKNQLVLKSNGQEAIDYIQKTVLPEKYAPLSFGRGLDQKDEDDSEGIHSQIALIVLDLNLPVVNGMDVLGFIKRSPAYCSIPVIIVSTSHDTETISEAYKNGANGFITKSYLSEEEYLENARLLGEYCKLALSEDFSTSRGN